MAGCAGFTSLEGSKGLTGLVILLCSFLVFLTIMLRSGPKKGSVDIFVFTPPWVKMSVYLFLGSAVFSAHSPFLTPPGASGSWKETEICNQERKIVS